MKISRVYSVFKGIQRESKSKSVQKQPFLELYSGAIIYVARKSVPFLRVEEIFSVFKMFERRRKKKEDGKRKKSEKSGCTTNKYRAGDRSPYFIANMLSSRADGLFTLPCFSFLNLYFVFSIT